MGESSKPEVGSIGWLDLTVPGAGGIRDFYAEVVGFEPQPVPMGDYSDYNMTSPESGTPRAGVCHRRGGNADLPGAWLPYFIVADLDASLSAIGRLGGKVVAGPKTMPGQGRYCVLEDPAGAFAALFEPE